MSADITIRQLPKESVAAEAETEQAAEFIDAWLPTRKDAHMRAVDNGRIFFQQEDLDDFLAAAKRENYSVEDLT